MDVDYVNGWVCQPDVCRCCLSARGSCDITARYVSDSGKKEIYHDMLQECLGITLSHLDEWSHSRLVCTLCVSQLRLAYAFKNQVLQSERHFNLYCDSQREFNDFKIEEGVTENDTEKLHHIDQPPCNEGKVKLEALEDLKESNFGNEELPLLSPNGIRKHVRKRSLAKLKLKKDTKDILTEDIDYDSDIPISKLAEKTKHMKKIVSEITRTQPKSSLMENIARPDRDARERLKQAPNKKPVKLVSERKRVILTCGTVLRDTTACPFRHHKSWFQCFFCLQDFMEINPLRDHTLSVHADVDEELKKMKRYPRSLQIEISNLQCRHCNLTLADVNAMRCHFVDVHNKVIYNECIADYKVDSSPYSCHICKQEFHVFRTLTTHLNEHYANCICDVCGKSFLNSKRLKVHKRTHESGSYPCNECGKVLKTKTSKANHVESVHSKRTIKCQICMKPMKHYNDRIKHMSEVHNITHKFKCPICSREYNIKHYLATHIRQTHGHKNKKCAECGMAFITNHGLKKHMLKHSGEKPFTCDVCCKSYARSYTLREHMRTHDVDKRILRSE
ncbi:unnamed protein product [Parnassius apollo]|uniref:(apollo) hypothetical protein n=1 Tax=Parnassius apollo TaxID=110799 RepID=A0A8S3YD07_PARAO|nr:unnamed protein product [Parnassius apollo]